MTAQTAAYRRTITALLQLDLTFYSFHPEQKDLPSIQMRAYCSKYKEQAASKISSVHFSQNIRSPFRMQKDKTSGRTIQYD